jgi:hypothetical protein
MKFVAEHTFRGITAPDYEKLYFDEAFNEALCKALNLDRTLVKREDNGKHLHRVVKVAPRDREIPGPVQKILGSSRIEYAEHIDYDWGTLTGTWKSVSSIMTDKIETKGIFRFDTNSDGVKRVVEGDIKVKVFGVGGVIERFIVADIEKSYEQAADFTRRWIASGGKV